jgi:ATP-dependent RNA helicase RhlE
MNEEFKTQTRKLFKSGNALVVKADVNAHFELILQLIIDEIPEPKEGSPRGIVLFSTDVLATEFNEFIRESFKKHDLTSDLIIEKGHRVQQRNDLYFGTELIIGTPKRICELYFQNGFNIGELKVFMVLGVNAIFSKGHKGFVNRLSESLPKCKKLVFESSGKEERVNAYCREFLSPFKRIAE